MLAPIWTNGALAVTILNTKIRVLITDDDADAQDDLRKMLLREPDIEIVGIADTGRSAVKMTSELSPDVVLMDAKLPDMGGLDVTETLLSQHRGIAVIILAVEGEPSQLRQAMLAGAADYLTRPISTEELVSSIRAVFKRESQRRQLAPRPELHPPATVASDKGTLIAVFSPKGGTGKTTIAVNLATAIAAATHQKVALVDGSLLFGDVGVFMNLTGTKSIMDLLPRVGELDRDLLLDVMIEHQSGVRVLLAPPRPELAELVGPDSLKVVLTKLRSSFDFVVVDTQTSFDECTLTVLDNADRIVLVVTLEVTALKNLKLFLDMAESLGYPARKLMLTINRGDSTAGIGVKEVEEKIRLKVAAMLANDWKTTTVATNRGVPLVISHPEARIAKDFMALAQTVALPEGVEAKTSPTVEKTKRSFGGFRLSLR